MATGKIDYVCVKAATYNQAHQNVPDMQHPKRIWESLAAAVKAVVDVPVIAVGRINEPTDAADVLRLGHADMVAMTRQQIADPETVNKMRDGRLDEIRRCIGCNQGASTGCSTSRTRPAYTIRPPDTSASWASGP